MKRLNEVQPLNQKRIEEREREIKETFHGSHCCNVCYVLLLMAVSYG